MSATCPAQRLHVLQPDTVFNPPRARVVGFGLGGAYVASYTALSIGWYGSGLQGPFRWFDDSQQWLQLDKLGHSYGSYLEARLLNDALLWAGVARNKRLLWVPVASFLMQSNVEILDGFSPDYGASYTDLVANAGGSLLWLANEWAFRKQVFVLKWSFWPSGQAHLRPDVLGATLPEQLLKDYNGQTYWLGIHPEALLPEGSMVRRVYPNWLGVAVGYGGRGMVGGYGTEPQAVIEAREVRQWYLGLDVNFREIPTRRRGLKLLFGLLDCIRVPLPALRFDGQGRTRFFPVFLSE